MRKPCPLLPQQPVGRHPGLLEQDRGGGARAHAHLALGRLRQQARRRGLGEQARDALGDRPHPCGPSGCRSRPRRRGSPTPWPRRRPSCRRRAPPWSAAPPRRSRCPPRTGSTPRAARRRACRRRPALALLVRAERRERVAGQRVDARAERAGQPAAAELLEHLQVDLVRLRRRPACSSYGRPMSPALPRVRNSARGTRRGPRRPAARGATSRSTRSRVSASSSCASGSAGCGRRAACGPPGGGASTLSPDRAARGLAGWARARPADAPRRPLALVPRLPRRARVDHRAGRLARSTPCAARSTWSRGS